MFKKQSKIRANYDSKVTSFLSIFSSKSSSAQFLLPMGKPNKKPESKTKAPESLTGKNFWIIGRNFGVSEGRILEAIITFDKIAKGKSQEKSFY